MGTKISGFGVEAAFGKHVGQTAPYAHRTPGFFYTKGSFINVSAGAGDAGKPIKLNASGLIDPTMYVGGANHNFLSTSHPDTVVGTVVRGDLIVGNVTPKWTKLALGTTGKFLRSDGNDALWVSIVSGDLPSHTHVKVNITDTPWAWADVLKTGSNLTDLATRAHAGLSDAPADAHHPQSHSLASHSSKAHSELSDAPTDAHHLQSHTLASHSTKPHSALSDAPANAHHPQSHTLASHSTRPHSALSDAPANAHHPQTHSLGSHSDFGTYINQAVRSDSDVTFNQATITNDLYCLGGRLHCSSLKSTNTRLTLFCNPNIGSGYIDLSTPEVGGGIGLVIPETDGYLSITEDQTWDAIIRAWANGRVALFGIPTYSNNAAARAGGLTDGHLYKTAGETKYVMIVGAAP